MTLSLHLCEDLDLPERQSVRTPMQWDSGKNGGFSTARRDQLYLPSVAEGPYGYERLNVLDQRGDPESMLNWTRRLISAHQEARPVAHGDWQVIEPETKEILGIRYELDDEVVFIYHNLSEDPKKASYPEKGSLAFLYEIFADTDYGHPDLDRSRFELNPLGYRWLQGRLNS